jgi:hypothetical protein
VVASEGKDLAGSTRLSVAAAAEQVPGAALARA